MHAHVHRKGGKITGLGVTQTCTHKQQKNCSKRLCSDKKTRRVEQTQVPRKRRGGKTTKEDFQDDTRAETREKRVQYKDDWEKLQTLKQKKEGKAQIANGEQEVEIKMLSLKNFWE